MFYRFVEATISWVKMNQMRFSGELVAVQSMFTCPVDMQTMKSVESVLQRSICYVWWHTISIREKNLHTMAFIHVFNWRWTLVYSYNCWRCRKPNRNCIRPVYINWALSFADAVWTDVSPFIRSVWWIRVVIPIFTNN